MVITTNPAFVQPKPAAAALSPAPAPKPPVDTVTMTHKFDQAHPESSFQKARHWLSNAFLPTNYETTCSHDYLPTRRWMLAHDLSMNIGNFAVGAALATALGANPIWGGVAMNTFNTIKGKFCETAGFLTNYAASMADKNPRPWMLAGSLGDNTGMIAESCAALFPAKALLPVGTGISIYRVFAGSMKGAAMADIDILQAKDDNLGDLRRKNGIQGYFVSLLGTAAAMKGLQVLSQHVGPWAPPIMATASAICASLAMSRVDANLEFFPVNEQTVRKLVDSLDKDNSVPKAEGINMGEITNLHRITTGKDMSVLQKDPKHFEELLDIYKGRQYLVDLVDGKPYIVLSEQSGASDRFLAVMQAVRMEKMLADGAFKAQVDSQGQEKATHWLLEQTNHEVPSDASILLSRLKEQGWTVDKLRFFDAGKRGRWDAEGQYELPLPVPPQPSGQAPAPAPAPAPKAS